MDQTPATPNTGSSEAEPIWREYSWLWLGLAILLSAAAVMLLPRAAEGSSSDLGPPIALLAGTSVTVALICGVAIFVLVKRHLGLGTLTAVYAVGYNVLIIAVKFGLSPYGLYKTAQVDELRMIISVDNRLGATITALSVFVLYAAVFGLIYRYFKRMLPARQQSSRARIVTAAVVLVVLFAGAAAPFTLILPFAGMEYVGYVLASASGVLIGFALALATLLVIRCFSSATDRARAAGQAATLGGLFWLGLSLLALYHVLWVVYILLLITLWPLRVITPK